ncbi:nuclear transport factor 2B-like [Eucalyptus grandis]|uniref:nuclear transport factor 2B-like n=1 Tax=Eucalyptus grandis TaxID=71139 RepID=UPI00192EE079|nr:nuclear transport factor 2B-like [Eucalyptus grandis]
MSMVGPEEDRDPMIAEAERFVENYYSTFDANREGLVNLYRQRSVLIFGGRKIQGKEAILAKLTSLPQPCHHEIAEFKCRTYRLAPASVAVFVGVRGGTWVGGKKEEADGALIEQGFDLVPARGGSFYIAEQSGMFFDLKKPRTGRMSTWVPKLPAPGTPMYASLFQILSSAYPPTSAATAPSTPPHFERLSISNPNTHDETSSVSTET